MPGTDIRQGERCQVGAEFTKKSDFVQAAQLLERLGLRFRAPKQARATSRALDFRSGQNTSEPLGITPPTSSLSNYRPQSALPSSQWSWSPRQFESASSPSSQPTFFSDHMPGKRPRSTLAIPSLRSESPVSTPHLTSRAPIPSSNLFITQDASHNSLPPSFSREPLFAPRSEEFRSMDPDREPSLRESPHWNGESFRSWQDSYSALSPYRTSSPGSHLTLSQLSPLDELESMMPPPRQLPYMSAEKPKGTVDRLKSMRSSESHSVKSIRSAGTAKTAESRTKRDSTVGLALRL